MEPPIKEFNSHLEEIDMKKPEGVSTQGHEKLGSLGVILKSRIQESSTSNESRRSIWATVCGLLKVIPRALGFGLINHALHALRHPAGRGLREPRKIAIRRNRLIALSHSLLHVVPVGIAICEIILNWNTFYAGTRILSPAIYQILAKVHEIMIQASIATLIFSFVRRELALGEGIPFGLLFSGLQVSQISYLWSMEFWGSLSSGYGRRLRTIGLFAFIFLNIVLATACGPSSAVLLIPRLEYWPAGRTHIWLNATQNEVWPTYLDDSSISESCSRISPGAPSDGCPSSEWGAIRDYLLLTQQILPQSYINTYGFAENPTSIVFSGKASRHLLDIDEDEAFIGNGPRPQVATTPHTAIADALTRTGALWFLSLTNVTAKQGHGSPLSDQSDAIHTINSNYSQPYSSVVCVTDSIHNNSDSRRLVFPFLPNANAESLVNGNLTYKARGGAQTAQTIEHPNFTYRQALDAAGSATEYRLRWIELPQSAFRGSSIGAVIILPHDGKNASQNILTCNVSAGWGTAAIQLNTLDGDTSVVTSKLVKTLSDSARAPPISQTNTPTAEVDEDGEFEYRYPEYPERLINITQGWANYLNPLVIGQNTSVINLLMQEEIFQGLPSVAARQILASLVVNGLSRTSFQSQLQGHVRTVAPNSNIGLDGNYWLSGKGDVFDLDPIQAKNWVTFRVDSTLKGYAYNTNSVPPRLAIAFLTTYCILALVHVAYYGLTGISSTCWDSIAEVTALAMNSTPTAALRNTCAGITELHVFRLPVRVLVARDEESAGEHLELVFGNVDQEKIKDTIIKDNTAY